MSGKDIKALHKQLQKTFTDQDVAKRAFVSEVINALMDEGKIRRFWPSCLSCQNWDEKRELCKLNGCRPPATVIIDACECYVDVPFE